MNCLFCKIIEGKIKSEKIYEDEHVFAMLDAQPISPGHTLVLPKIHVKNIIDLPDENIESFFKGVKNVAKILEDKLSPDGFTHGINHKVGQAIDHLHFHIVPRWENDGGGSIHGVVSNKPKESVEEMAKMILKN